jgi:hypothetical protein
MTARNFRGQTRTCLQIAYKRSSRRYKLDLSIQLLDLPNGPETEKDAMKEFLRALEVQRQDDHRFYHHSRINQSLHFISAASFICAYCFLFIDPATAALIGWLISMSTRQSGHFFFEPKGFDAVNGVTHEYKEEVKVGYNLRRKVVFMTLWALSPLVLLWDPTLFGLMQARSGAAGLVKEVGLLWLALGVGGLLFRVVQLFFIRDVQTGIVWFCKIITDPFHDVKLYCKAPLYLMRGQLIDPMLHTEER